MREAAPVPSPSQPAASGATRARTRSPAARGAAVPCLGHARARLLAAATLAASGARARTRSPAARGAPRAASSAPPPSIGAPRPAIGAAPNRAARRGALPRAAIAAVPIGARAAPGGACGDAWDAWEPRFEQRRH